MSIKYLLILLNWRFALNSQGGSSIIYPQLFLGDLVSCLRYLCLLVYSGVLHKLCSVFGFFPSFKFKPQLSVVERHKRDVPLNYKFAWIKPCTIDFSYTSSKPNGTTFELTATDMVDDKVLEKVGLYVK
jgi:hypothetical protein